MARPSANYCAARDIRFIGDIAIFVNYDSADVWTHPEPLRARQGPPAIRVAGVPADYFSQTAASAGAIPSTSGTSSSNLARLVGRPHPPRPVPLRRHPPRPLRGFEAYWAIPAQDETAVNGKWVKAPGTALFQKLHDELGDLPFIRRRPRPDHQKKWMLYVSSSTFPA